jgi:hypothetical protein
LLLFHGSLLPEVEVKGLDDEPGVLDLGVQVESESNHGTQGFTRRPTNGGSGLIGPTCGPARIGQGPGWPEDPCLQPPLKESGSKPQRIAAVSTPQPAAKNIRNNRRAVPPPFIVGSLLARSRIKPPAPRHLAYLHARKPNTAHSTCANRRNTTRAVPYPSRLPRDRQTTWPRNRLRRGSALASTARTTPAICSAPNA